MYILTETINFIRLAKLHCRSDAALCCLIVEEESWMTDCIFILSNKTNFCSRIRFYDPINRIYRIVKSYLTPVPTRRSPTTVILRRLMMMLLLLISTLIVPLPLRRTLLILSLSPVIVLGSTVLLRRGATEVLLTITLILILVISTLILLGWRGLV